MKRALTCPGCKGEAWRVIYYGLPHRLCADEDCARIWGWASWLTAWLPFNGLLLRYRGGYWSALWRWLTWEEWTA